MGTRILALVGAAGGVGTTRLAVEFGALLASTDQDVAIVDAAFTTQGLSSYIADSITKDATALATGEATLEEALYSHDADVSGTLSVCPARAPFERQSRAKTAGAAERFERQLAATSLSHDVVIVDTPPVGSNPALGAVNAADRIAIVTRPTERGSDAVALTQERLADIGREADAIIANHAGKDVQSRADAHVPASDVRSPRNAPACLPPQGEFSRAVVDALETILERPLEIDVSEPGRFDRFKPS